MLMFSFYLFSRPSSIYAGDIFCVGWLPTMVAGLEWKPMNSKAAIGIMIFGASFSFKLVYKERWV
ncbi:hypothetical protein [Halobacillus litoralis]|uniref:Uncharacterized protein n=1 Tax=Halobacillus litoralis TaxID=45668 RepID=A0A410MFS7_9BACI|nr:hypothetical protein [Halobacillus litoralis]QAS53558.1 hypothetical protein HLI_15795 [Halobacillus litoralis]